MSTKIDWTKPLESQTSPGNWVPAYVVYANSWAHVLRIPYPDGSEGIQIVDTALKCRGYRNKPEMVERVVYLKQNISGDTWCSDQRDPKLIIASARVTFTIGTFAEDET